MAGTAGSRQRYIVSPAGRSSTQALSLPDLHHSWYRFIPFLGYHHVLMIVALFTIIFWSILLAGCSSYSLKDVTLLSLSYRAGEVVAGAPDPLQLNPSAADSFVQLLKNDTVTIQQINIGFMAMCLKLHSGTWLCGASAQDMVGGLDGDRSADPLNLIWIAENIRTGTLFFGLIIVATVFTFLGILLLATFPGWHEEEESEGSEREVKPFPSRAVSQVCLAIFGLAFLLSFTTVLWQHLGSAAAQTLTKMLTYDTIDTSVGAGAMALGWVGVGCCGFVTIGLAIMILSIRVLSEAAD